MEVIGNVSNRFIESLKKDVENLNKRLEDFIKGFKSEYKPFAIPTKPQEDKPATKCDIIMFKKKDKPQREKERQ